MPVLLDLFISFAGIGLFTFGGGYAMLSLIENICVEKKHWITHEEMMDITVIAESTPGPVAINCATYIGYKKGKLAGAVLATLGVTLPSFIIIFIISIYLERFMEITWVAHAFAGIKLAVGILIVDAAVKMIIKMKKKPMQMGILTASFIVMILINILRLPVSSVLIMLATAIFSVAAFLLKKDREGGERRNGGPA